jgi:hypothetical protein
VDDPKGRSPPRARRLCARVGLRGPPSRARIRGGFPPSWCRKSEKVVFKHGPQAGGSHRLKANQGECTTPLAYCPPASRAAAAALRRAPRRPTSVHLHSTARPSQPPPHAQRALQLHTVCAHHLGCPPKWSREHAGAGRRRGAVQWAEWRRRPRCLLAPAASKPALLRARTPAYLHCPKLRERTQPLPPTLTAPVLRTPQDRRGQGGRRRRHHHRRRRRRRRRCRCLGRQTNRCAPLCTHIPHTTHTCTYTQYVLGTTSWLLYAFLREMAIGAPWCSRPLAALIVMRHTQALPPSLFPPLMSCYLLSFADNAGHRIVAEAVRARIFADADQREAVDATRTRLPTTTRPLLATRLSQLLLPMTALASLPADPL